MKRMIVAAMAGSLLIALEVGAKESSTSAGLILKQTTSVRAQGMGSVQTAVATDEAGAVGWNPAALQNRDYPDLSAVYYRGLSDDSFGAFNYSLGVNPDLACGAGLLVYDAGVFELTNDAGQSTSVSAQRDIQATLTGAFLTQVMGTSLVAGANLKALHSTLLEKYSAFAAAIDAGMRLETHGVQVGLALKNIGTPLTYLEAADSLPSYALLGLAYNLLQDAGVGILVAGDVQYDLERNAQASLGAETVLNEAYSLRVGYKMGADIASFTLGVGLRFNNFQVDYAFSPSAVLNSTHMASLKYSFAPLVKPKANEVEEALAADQEAAYVPEDVKPKSGDQPVEKIRTAIVEIRKAGGRPSEVIMNGGAEQEIKVGYQGVIVDSSDRPRAAIIIRQVDPNISLADIIGLSRDIDANMIVIIEKPLPSTEGQ